MFGGKRIEALEARLDEMETQLDRRVNAAMEELRAEVRSQMERALSGIEDDPAKRLAMVVAGVERALGERVESLEPRIATAERLLDQIHEMAAPVATRARSTPDFGIDHEAKQTGLLSLWFDGGWNDKAVVYVNGESVGRINSVNDINSSFAVVIRAGETYRIESESVERRGETGAQTLFTPFGV